MQSSSTCCSSEALTSHIRWQNLPSFERQEHRRAVAQQPVQGDARLIAQLSPTLVATGTATPTLYLRSGLDLSKTPAPPAGRSAISGTIATPSRRCSPATSSGGRLIASSLTSSSVLDSPSKPDLSPCQHLLVLERREQLPRAAPLSHPNAGRARQSAMALSQTLTLTLA